MGTLKRQQSLVIVAIFVATPKIQLATCMIGMSIWIRSGSMDILDMSTHLVRMSLNRETRIILFDDPEHARARLYIPCIYCVCTCSIIISLCILLLISSDDATLRFVVLIRTSQSIASRVEPSTSRNGVSRRNCLDQKARYIPLNALTNKLNSFMFPRSQKSILSPH